MIAFHAVEPGLTPERIDERLAAGWFPYGQHWMTCRMWPEEPGAAVDTVWIRVRLGPRRRPDRLRKALREGLTVTWGDPVLDDEHQAVYEAFRTTHPTWQTGPVGDLLLHQGSPGPLMARTREAALRDGVGRLVAFRWYLEGKDTIAGITSVFLPSESGYGGLARRIVDDHACEEGRQWTYPGYVRPGAVDPWRYKLVDGRTEWLDATTGEWRPWEGDGPSPETLLVAQMRRRLAALGEVREYSRWASPWFDRRSRELPVPFYVVTEAREADQDVVVWDPGARRYRSLVVTPGLADDAPALYVVAQKRKASPPPPE